MSRSAMILGPALILAGLFLLLGNLGFAPAASLWPLLFFLAGVGLLVVYQQNKAKDSLLWLGSLLLLLGSFFLIAGHVGYGKHWPFFVLAPALATTSVWAFGRSGSEARIPALVLLALAAFNYLLAWGIFARIFEVLTGIVILLLTVLAPLLLIGLGSWILFQGRRKPQPEPASTIPEKIEARPPTPEREPEPEPPIS